MQNEIPHLIVLEFGNGTVWASLNDGTLHTVARGVSQPPEWAPALGRRAGATNYFAGRVDALRPAAATRTHA